MLSLVAPVLPAFPATGMNPPDPGVLTYLLNAFVGGFSGGYGGILPIAQRILFLLAAIEIVFAGLWWALKGENFIVPLIQKTMLIGVFAAFLLPGPLNWATLMSSLLRGFVATGQSAGGGAGNVNWFSDPSAIVNLADALTIQIEQEIHALPVLAVGQQIMFGLVYLLIYLTFFILAIQVVIAILEFYLIATLAMALVPFGVNKYTAFLSEKAFGAVVSHGVKLMVLAFIITVAAPVMAGLNLPPNPSLQQAYMCLLAAMTLTFLAWKAPDVAAGLFAGGPSLTAAHSLGTAAVGARLLMGVGAGGRARSFFGFGKAAGQLGGGLKAITRGAGALAGGASGGAAMASLGGATRTGMLLGATRGAASVVGSVAARPVMTGARALRGAWETGRVAGFRTSTGVRGTTP
jgi:type IV secretion system protein TrbL